jgi:hypothetical protein
MYVCACVYVCTYYYVYMCVCMYECLLHVCTVCVYIHVCVFTVCVFMYLCMYVRVCTYVCICIWRCVCKYVCMYVCMYLRMYVCIVMFPSLNVAMDVQPRCLKYYCHHRPVQGCGSSNCWRVKLFRFFNFVGKISTEKIAYKCFAIYPFLGSMPQLSFIITETRNCLFYVLSRSLFCIV